MGQRFVACDREQSFLMPPDVREWLPEGHLAWFVIDAVAEMDLEAFYAAYRRDDRESLPKTFARPSPAHASGAECRYSTGLPHKSKPLEKSPASPQPAGTADEGMPDGESPPHVRRASVVETDNERRSSLTYATAPDDLGTLAGGRAAALWVDASSHRVADAFPRGCRVSRDVVRWV
jgi:hypothetical protein